MSEAVLARGYVQSRVYMDTVVTIEVARPGPEEECRGQVERAFGWFAEVEKRCSRFDPSSELRGLLTSDGAPVAISPLLFHALDFALKVARASGGAFDPTIGTRMEAAGFAKNYKSGETTATGLALENTGCIDDVILDAAGMTVALRRPVVLDLGAVAKGLAMDLAGQELRAAGGFAINAGGDVLVHGLNTDGELWRIGVRHPRRPEELLCVLRLTDGAVCTSGDYERPQPGGDGHHILDPRSGRSTASVVSLTAVGPTAMTADALSTAAFVMGPDSGLELLTHQGLEALIVAGDLQMSTSAGLSRYL